jgi:hypothetical protein
MRAIATTTQQNPGAIGIAHGAAEAAVNGFDWSNLIALHLNIVDLLRGSSS